MPNSIKYSASAQTLALKKGSLWIGTGDVGKGPSSTTGYYNGVTPAAGGYTIYSYSATQTGNLSYFSAANDAALIAETNRIAGSSYTTAAQCLDYFAGQTDKMVFNIDYPAIVTNGLVLSLDAGFTPSYPTTGTTWYDLGGNGYNGTLTNGPTFSSTNGGSIVFDGVDDYVNLGTTLNNYQRVNLPYTMESFVYLNTSNNNEFIIGNTWDDNGFHIRKRGSSHPPANGIRFLLVQDGSNGCGKDSTPLTSGWYHIVGTYNGSGASTPSNYNLYINSSTGGTTDVTFGTPTSITPTNDTNIGRSGDVTNYGYLNGVVSVIRIYNRALTAAEVLQNYNAQKSRFGL